MNRFEYEEFIKCADDVQYFIETYVKALSVDKGFVPVVLNDFQKEAIKDYKEKKFFSKSTARQKGKTFIAACLLLHTSMFKEYQTSVIVASTYARAAGINSTILSIYDNLPDFLKVVKLETRNKSHLVFDTSSEILFMGSTSTAMRGRTIHNLYFDESDYIANLRELVAAFYPCIVSSYNGSRVFAFTTGKTDDLFRSMELSVA